MSVLGSFDILIMLAAVGLAAGLLIVLRRVWPTDSRRLYNDLIGWQIGVLGTTYAVIIGFMLYAVWTNFEVAESNAENEANSLVNLVRLSDGLPAEARVRVHSLAKQYVDLMLTKEWPEMSRGQISPESHRLMTDLWSTLNAAEVQSAREQIGLDHALSELTKLAEYRRSRELQVDSYLPDILWLVLVTGAIMTILSACLFASTNFHLHLIQLIMLTLMLVSVLIAIGDINHPFQGAVHVDPGGFERARDTLRDLR
jgi:amino acid transporter